MCAGLDLNMRVGRQVPARWSQKPTPYDVSAKGLRFHAESTIYGMSSFAREKLYVPLACRSQREEGTIECSDLWKTAATMCKELQSTSSV